MQPSALAAIRFANHKIEKEVALQNSKFMYGLLFCNSMVISMIIFVIGALMAIVGIVGVIFFERISKRFFKEQTDKFVRLMRFVFLVVFVLGLYLAAAQVQGVKQPL